MRTQTAAERILAFLGEHAPYNHFTNNEIAQNLNLPVDSVRRVINELRATGEVIRVALAYGGYANTLPAMDGEVAVGQ